MKYIVITGPDCKWCNKAKAALTLMDKEFIEMNIEPSPDRPHVRYPEHAAFDMWKAMGFKTVPQVFYGPTYIGGYEALTKHLNP